MHWEDIVTIILGFIIGIVIFVILGFLSKDINESMSKRECYEIYATDNVILKKCKKYFESKE